MEPNNLTIAYKPDFIDGDALKITINSILSNFPGGIAFLLEAETGTMDELKVLQMFINAERQEDLDDAEIKIEQVLSYVASSLFDINESYRYGIIAILIGDNEGEGGIEKDIPITFPLLEEIGFKPKLAYHQLAYEEGEEIEVIQHDGYWSARTTSNGRSRFEFRKKFKTIQEIIKLIELVTGECKTIK